MDDITRSYLNAFSMKIGFPDSISESTLFEHFVAFSLLNHDIIGSISKDDLEQISAGQTRGIDSVAITINSKLVTSPNELQTKYKEQSISSDIYFIQSKTSDCFNDAQATIFLDMVIDFFRDTPTHNVPELETKREIYRKLLKIVGSIRELKLKCYYATLGTKQENPTTITEMIAGKKSELENLGLFSSVDIILCDKATLLNKHKKAINPLKASFKFENKQTLSGIAEVEEAYIGFIPFSEFRKLIMDDENDKIKSLFNDNLRDFLGIENSVNLSIKKTLEEGRFNEFSLLNNGITVIADSNIGRGNNFVLENYQIVNGCQTSNVLYQCRNASGIDKTLIPLKVVITQNNSLRNSIILSTNSQSGFSEEQLFALTDFQTILEDLYTANRDADGLYYERRTNQYASRGINGTDIIDIKEQLKAFMAMFYEIPYYVAGNIGKVITKHKNDFFLKGHDPLPYYIAGLISSKWQKLINQSSTHAEFNKYRYQLFMGFRFLVERIRFNVSFLSNVKGYSINQNGLPRVSCYQEILESLRNQDSFLNNINEAIRILKLSDYTRPKGAYSNPITQEYIINLISTKNYETT